MAVAQGAKPGLNGAVIHLSLLFEKIRFGEPFGFGWILITEGIIASRERLTMKAASQISRQKALITQALKTEEKLGFLSSHQISAKAAAEPRTSGAMKCWLSIKSFFSRTYEHATTFNSAEKQDMYARHAIADFSRELGIVLENLNPTHGAKPGCLDKEQWPSLQATYQKAYGRCASEKMLGQIMDKHLTRFSAKQKVELARYLEPVKKEGGLHIIDDLRNEMHSRISNAKKITIEWVFSREKMPVGGAHEDDRDKGDRDIVNAHLATLNVYGGMSDPEIKQHFERKWASLNIKEQLILLEFCMDDRQVFANCEQLLAQSFKANVKRKNWWHAGTVDEGIAVSAALEKKFESGVAIYEKKAKEQISAFFEGKDEAALKIVESAFLEKVIDWKSQGIDVRGQLKNQLKSLSPFSKVRALHLMNSVAESQEKIEIQSNVYCATENLVKMMSLEEAFLMLKPEDLTDKELKTVIEIVGDKTSHENLRKIQDSLRLEANKRVSVKSTGEVYINNHGARKSLVYGLFYGTFMQTLSGVLNLSRYIDQQMHVADVNSEKPFMKDLIEKLVSSFAPDELQELMDAKHLHRLAGIIESLANVKDVRAVRARNVAKALYSTLTKNDIENQSVKQFRQRSSIRLGKLSRSFSGCRI
jgi:hypothetical protein